MDQDVEYSEQGWFGRIKDSIKGVLFGIVLICGGIGLLFWNEGRAVKRAQDLAVGKDSVVSIDAGDVDAANDGQLVHLSGKAVADEPLTDHDFGVSADALELDRDVQMYQWVEKEKKTSKKKLGGKKVTKTTYTYSRKWTSKSVNSGRFHTSSGHQNPPKIPYDNESYQADVTIGAFELAPSAVDKIGNADELNIDDASVKRLKQIHGDTVNVTGGTVYLGGRSTQPSVGDVRVRYTVVRPQQVTVVAAQQGPRLAPYSTDELNDTLELVSTGKVSAKGMFDEAASDNATMTWVLRGVGFILLLIGFGLLFAPLSVMADLIPMAGAIVEFGTKLVAGVCAAGLSLVCISIGWLFYRPLIGIPLLVIGVGCFGALIWKLVAGSSQPDTSQ